MKLDGISPIQYDEALGIWLKRDDLFEYAGVRGGKVRTCLALAKRDSYLKGLVTAGARTSPQCNIVASIAQNLGVPCRVHTPSGPLGLEVCEAHNKGAEVVQHRPGYNSVIVARARQDAWVRGWINIPFGMECDEAVVQTERQVVNLPPEALRIVVPVGSGMSLAGILCGMGRRADNRPVIGVVMGADPRRRLDAYGPWNWQTRVSLIPAGVPYHTEVHGMTAGGTILDSVYEAKCVRHLRRGDCLWVVGIGSTRA
jgi:1-aminocyclopropane-1-carboxylate deaminase/D-cysteine desulfhydrase-like pyridoxal-dependent ACC family enzyme